ncbi:M12 family metallo-peptidase [uncultured Flavobacterium sp.]|uniref:M12 family metallo-peptidase n=1 Tax=uncultured Flavobacterium sp. TaxID=165435 RepID=UPI0025DAEFBA|nr:M12 family metallo-peptidase [uncultured Flavobacterium sp.]
MKKIILLLLLSGSMFAQELKQVPKQILEFQSQNKEFSKISLFAVNENYDHKKFDKEVDGATVVTLNQNALNAVIAEKPQLLQFSLPYNNKQLEIVLYKVQIQSDDFQVDTDKAKNVTVEKGVHYRGIINGNVNSIVSFNFFRNDVNGIISGNEIHNLNIGKLAVDGNVNDYIIYSDTKLKKPFNFTCDLKSAKASHSSVNHRDTQSPNSAKCVAIYFELDYNSYTSHGSDLTTTLNWFSSIFNNVQTLYANDGISTAIKSVFVWTSLDPYAESESSGAYLNNFLVNRPVFNGDLGHLVNYDGGGFGGVAYMSGLCNTVKHGFSDIETTFSMVPQYSWTVEVITHELGHQMGSDHTHACVWNGNNTSIDGCGTLAGIPEGDCAEGPIPTQAVGGTIMSYCHLLGDEVGINFANGFGPQPTALILDRIASSQCLSTDCITTCINNVSNVVVQNVNETTADMTWNDSTTTTWQVAAVSYPYTSPVWVTATTNSHSFTQLTPNTYYKFMVRPFCNAPQEAAVTFKIEATKSNFVCSGIPFTDTGLLTSNYLDLENWTRTFTPPAGLAARVVFNTVNLEEGYDVLYIYDGPDATFPLFGTVTGEQTNLTFEATNSTGALTFKFESDSNTNEAGWDATLTCSALGRNDFVKAGFSYYPNPVKDELALNSKTGIEKIQIYSIDGKLIFEQTKQVYDTKINTAAFAKGTYIVKIAFAEGNNGAFKIVK